MLPFLRRLRHPLRRPIHFYRIYEPSPTPRQLERQRERERQEASDKIENEWDDERAGRKRPSSPEELPVIIDRGPYKGLVYPKEDLYYNSIMLASDVEPMYVGPPGGHLRQEVYRTPFRRLNAISGVNSSPRLVPDEHLTASQNADKLRRWEDRNGKNVGTRHIESPTVIRLELPKHPPSDPRAPSPPRGPITPGSQEWDIFMDFPSEYSMHMYHDGESDQPAGPTSTTPALPKPVAVFKTGNRTIQGDAQCRPSAQEIPLSVQAPDQPPSNPPVPSLHGSKDPEILTWNTALKRSLNNESINLEMRAAVRERVERSSKTNVPEYMHNQPISAVDSDPVPNLSHLVAESAFHDRMTDENVFAIRSAAHSEGQRQRELLPNGVSSGHYNLPTPDVNTTMKWPLTLREGQDLSHGQLPNGVPANYYPPSSSSDSSFGQHQPLPPDNVADCVSNLLYNILTSSELDLHAGIVGGSAPAHSSALSALEPPSNATSATPLHDRLIGKLHSTVYGLQDRITGLEEDLVPHMSAWLSQKELQIGELNAKAGDLDDEINALKQIVDFGIKLLNGCWEREWELWSTLIDIQKQRESNRSSLSRIFSRRKSTIVSDWQLLGGSMPRDYVTRISSPSRSTQRLLKTRELDAVLLIAKQNVTILKEDMGDMSGLVKAYQARAEIVEGLVPVEVSWRDI
ncbi:hypothetical protein PTT_09139 [Pyrenophora teres f. teres 0-1]|uniref:Uncharacterized protein n=1 Tax=Pyrenophora teres f. teres (strain 0-1) TaxID=861557 RepID=E3RLB3_PYRTT|nr:hypothetical protein PTT_09139 [Pyrenophora teres f. teres 0-1]